MIKHPKTRAQLMALYLVLLQHGRGVPITPLLKRVIEKLASHLGYAAPQSGQSIEAIAEPLLTELDRMLDEVVG